MKVQYTIRNVPPELDAKLRQRALLRKKSLNQIVLEALGITIAEDTTKIPDDYINHDFDWFIGKGGLEPEVEKALREMRVVNPKDWA